MKRIAAVVVLLGSGATTAHVADWPLRIESVRSPAADGSAQPQLSVVSGRGVLSWIERNGPTATLNMADRTGSGWSEPRAVASGDNWFVNWADVPSVTALADGSYAAHWLQKSASSTYAYDVRLSFSKDGRTWSPPVTPHHDGTPTEHGFASLYQAPGSGLGLIWLDGRAMKQDGGHDGHGDMSLRAATFDPSGKQMAETLVDARVCECCPTAAAVTADGVIVAYRNRSPEEVRDIYVARLENGRWTSPTAVHDDAWKINACPVNGPALSAQGRSVAIAWFNAVNDQAHVFAAFSRDSGRTFGAPIRIDESGTLGRVDVELLADGSAAVAWIEFGNLWKTPGENEFSTRFANQRAALQVRRVTPDGARSAPITVAGIGSTRASGYPRLARHGDELLFAWTETENGVSRVRTAAARLKN